MTDVKNYIKKNSIELTLIGIILITSFIFILIINLNVDYTSDDFKYRFVYDTLGNPLPTSRKISNPWDIVISMNNHWKMCNGRIVAHGLLQAVMPFGKLFLRIFNTIIYVLVGFLIYKHSTLGKKSDPSLLVFIFVLMWFFLPQFGLSVLWASGSANYLWTSCIILAFLIPYRMYANGSEKTINDGIKNAVLMGVFGLFAGCTNENNGGGVVLMGIMFIVLYKIKGMKVPKWSWIGVLTSIIGAVILIISPGNYRISSKASFAEIIKRFADVCEKTQGLTFSLIIILCVLVIIASIDKSNTTKSRKNRIIPIIYLTASAAMISVLTLAALRPERAWFSAITFIIIAIGWFWSEINFENFKPIFLTGIKGCAAVIAAVIFIISFNKEFAAVSSTYAQIKPGLEAIEQAKIMGVEEVTIPLVKPSTSKYDPYNGALYAVKDENSWVNTWMAAYYDLKKIKCED